MIFIGTPLIKTVDEAIKFKLSLTDFAVHDLVKDLIFHDVVSIKPNELSDDQSKLPPVTLPTENGSTKENKGPGRKKNVLQALFGSKIPKSSEEPPQSPRGEWEIMVEHTQT